MFPERLKALRKEAGYPNQTSIAKELHISQQTYSQWESGKRNPSKSTLETLADFFNVSTDYLLGKTDIKERNENNSIESTANVLFRTTVKDLNLTPEQEEQLKKDLNEFIKKRRKAFEDDL
ncbi:helix-turn-helix domain-containing protein [Streptococcus gallolyticus]|uniref:helix-turn-helix domain-containing protein n=1 Tax=Streptococcus gallolyticus TaxID=315405 RepID=UPI000210B81F|nr:helix-turn-helix transcriptional regulator [Streptococcus gallolyticus]BAK27040.1 ICESt1 APR2 Cro/CI family transcriptional regulator [Streptococcus gallolyticus subsp. gallolyticus ATCC 43143]